MNRTPEQLINYLNEIRITLDPDTIRKNNINGRRALFSMAEEFPNPDATIAALDRLRDYHEERM